MKIRHNQAGHNMMTTPRCKLVDLIRIKNHLARFDVILVLPFPEPNLVRGCMESNGYVHSMSLSCGRGNIIQLQGVTLWRANSDINCENPDPLNASSFNCGPVLRAIMAFIQRRCNQSPSCAYQAEYIDRNDCPDHHHLFNPTLLLLLEITYTCAPSKYMFYHLT